MSPLDPFPNPRPGGGPIIEPPHALLAAVTLAVLLAGCLGGSPAEEPEPSWGFDRVGQEAGFQRVIGAEVDPGGDYMLSLVGGVSAADVDGDGWTDLYVADAGPNRLYLNQGDGTFTEVAHEAGVAGDARSSMGLFLDVDDDGDPDLFVPNRQAPSRLYENLGNGTFRDVTEEAGVGASTWAYGATASDVDGDGDLDISVVNYHNVTGGQGPMQYDGATNGPRDLLYINQGNGTFTEEARQRGIDATRFTLSHAWADHDGDGDEDLYVNVDFGEDILYENQGNGTFQDVSRSVGIETDENGMGAVWTDVDNDLDLDLFATNIHMPALDDIDHFEGNDLFLNAGGSYRDVASRRGVDAGGWGWDSSWADLNHDGHVDGYQTNGMLTRPGPDLYYDSEVVVSRDLPSPGPNKIPLSRYGENAWIYLELPPDKRFTPDTHSVAAKQHDRLFVNMGQGHFQEAARDRGFEDWSDGRAVALLDVDRDGDLDMARSDYDRPLRLYENQAVEVADEENPRRWLQVELEGNASNRDAVGARVVLEAENSTMLRQATAGGGFMSQDQSALHFGLGSHETVDELRITWPSGETASFGNLSADQVIRVTEPDVLETGIRSGG